jgi:hypothetical protein
MDCETFELQTDYLLAHITGSTILHEIRLSLKLLKLFLFKTYQHYITLHVLTDIVIIRCQDVVL